MYSGFQYILAGDQGALHDVELNGGVESGHVTSADSQVLNEVETTPRIQAPSNG